MGWFVRCETRDIVDWETEGNTLQPGANIVSSLIAPEIPWRTEEMFLWMTKTVALVLNGNEEEESSRILNNFFGNMEFLKRKKLICIIRFGRLFK